MISGQQAPVLFDVLLLKPADSTVHAQPGTIQFDRPVNWYQHNQIALEWNYIEDCKSNHFANPR